MLFQFLSQEFFGNLCKCYLERDWFCQTKLRTRYTLISRTINQTISWVLPNKNVWIRYQLLWCSYQLLQTSITDRTSVRRTKWRKLLLSNRQMFLSEKIFNSSRSSMLLSSTWSSEYSGSGAASLFGQWEKPEKVLLDPVRMVHTASCSEKHRYVQSRLYGTVHSVISAQSKL